MNSIKEPSLTLLAAYLTRNTRSRMNLSQGCSQGFISAMSLFNNRHLACVVPVFWQTTDVYDEKFSNRFILIVHYSKAMRQSFPEGEFWKRVAPCWSISLVSQVSNYRDDLAFTLQSFTPRLWGECWKHLCGDAQPLVPQDQPLHFKK